MASKVQSPTSPSSGGAIPTLNNPSGGSISFSKNTEVPAWLFYATDPFILGVYRFLFSIWFLVLLFRRFVFNISQPSAQEFEEYSDFRFKYELLAWIPVPSGVWLRVYGWTMIFCTVMLLMGWCYRHACLILIMAQLWFMGWDASYYSDQNYFVLLLLCAFWATDTFNFGKLSGRLVTANAKPIDWKRKQQQGHAKWYRTLAFNNALSVEIAPHPAWHLWLFRVTVVLPYLCAAITMLNMDWFRGFPMTAWVPQELTSKEPVRRGFGIIFAWILLGSQLSCGIGLLHPNPRFRAMAVIILSWFHFIRLYWAPPNSAYLILQLFSFLLFLETHHLRSAFYAVGQISTSFMNFAHAFLPPFYDQNYVATIPVTVYFPDWQPPSPMLVYKYGNRVPGTLVPMRWRLRPVTASQRRFTLILLGIWVLLHGVIIPLRPFAYHALTPRHSVRWTEKGKTFTWSDQTSEKKCRGRYNVLNTETNAQFIVQSDDAVVTDPISLSPTQLQKRFTNPVFIVQYAHFLAQWYAEHWSCHPTKVRVTCNVECSLNGSPYQPFIDPKIDLASIHFSPFSFFPESYILPQTLSP